VDIWNELQIAETSDVAVIRRAYARRLKQVQPEDDPQGFQALRAAYETALRYSKFSAYSMDEDTSDSDALGAETVVLDKCLETNSQTSGSLVQLADASQGTNHSEVEAQNLIQDLMRILDKKGEVVAAERLFCIKESPAMENLETRYFFYDLLIETLYQRESMPFYFLERVVDLLKIESRSQTVASDLDHRHFYLLERLKGRRSYKGLLQTAGINGPLPKKDHLKLNALTSDQVFAAKILTGSYDPHRFRAIARWPWKRRPIFEAIERMKVTAPEMIQYELNPEIVGWWQDLKESADQRSHKLKKYAKVFLLLLLSSWIFASIANRVGEKSGKNLQLVLLVSAALTPTACVLTWKIFIKKTAIGRFASQLANGISAHISRRFNPHQVKAIFSFAFSLIIFALVLGVVFALGESGLRGPAIASMIIIGLISKRISRRNNSLIK
jgi:hypothetical protein